jgi:hypothetical protein
MLPEQDPSPVHESDACFPDPAIASCIGHIAKTAAMLTAPMRTK